MRVSGEAFVCDSYALQSRTTKTSFTNLIASSMSPSFTLMRLPSVTALLALMVMLALMLLRRGLIKETLLQSKAAFIVLQCTLHTL